MADEMSDERVTTQAAHYGRVPIETMMFRADVSDAECRLYAYLTTHDYARTGKCWPGRETAAAAFGWSVSKIDKLLRKLEENGCISRRQAGAGKTAEITLLADVVEVSALSDLTRLDGQHCTNEPSALSDPGDPSSTRTRENEMRTGALFDAHVLDDDFETWWKAYPVKKDKARARRCYHARRTDGATAGALTRARDGYIASRIDDADFPKWVKHAATFLAPDGPWTEWLDGDPDATPADDLGSVQQQLARAQWGGSR